MSQLVRHLLLAATLVGLSHVAAAQAPASPRIPEGLYQVVPDSSFSGGMDVSTFTIRFDGDSLMVVENSGAMMTRAHTSYDGEFFTWTDFEGELLCAGAAKYKWSIDSSKTTVRLTPVDDPCQERAAILAQIHLVKKL